MEAISELFLNNNVNNLSRESIERFSKFLVCREDMNTPNKVKPLLDYINGEFKQFNDNHPHFPLRCDYKDHDSNFLNTAWMSYYHKFIAKTYGNLKIN